MVMQIADTPVLKGKEAKRFVENAKNARENPIPKADYERAKITYEKMLKHNLGFLI